jgi:hypothetical protein
MKWSGNAIVLMILSKRLKIDWTTFPVGRFPGENIYSFKMLNLNLLYSMAFIMLLLANNSIFYHFLFL